MSFDKKKANETAEQDSWRNRVLRCEPPCDSFGICDNCHDAKVFDVGFIRGAEQYSQKASQAVMDLLFALRAIGDRPTMRDLVRLARRIKEG